MKLCSQKMRRHSKRCRGRVNHGWNLLGMHEAWPLRRRSDFSFTALASASERAENPHPVESIVGRDEVMSLMLAVKSLLVGSLVLWVQSSFFVSTICHCMFL
mmetsp:Transcript_6627/g.14345  ORF Transcript_6627/g.14345 Transcript_6627/m.14345 type:complete len:102 (+) Transcript_6627:255-560(+)